MRYTPKDKAEIALKSRRVDARFIAFPRAGRCARICHFPARMKAMID